MSSLKLNINFLCLGPVELAAAGVSIALFNQASRITIFPLVSITTSFVAEEDTINKINIRAAEKQFNDSIKTKSIEIMPGDHLLQDIEAGESKLNTEEKNGTLKNETKNGDGTFSLSFSIYVNFYFSLNLLGRWNERKWIF